MMITAALSTELTDDEVIERVLDNEVQLYEILVRRYNPYLYKIGRSYGYNHHDVEDLMQETFINAYAGLPKLINRSQFKTWLTRIMINECFRKREKLFFRNEVPASLFSTDKTSPMFSNNGANDAEKTVGNRELNSVIEKAIRNIPVDYRLVFCLREINGLSITETSDILKISPSNVKVRLNRAKAMLRKEVEKMYNKEEIFAFNLIYCNRIVSGVMARISIL